MLWLYLSKTQAIPIGKRGIGHFPAGHYAYIGSAFGAGGLNGRLKHHLVPAKKPHWHIDYLKAHAPIEAVWTLVSDQVYEHEWATYLLTLPEASVPMRGFGASDCRCIAHLVHFPRLPDVQLTSAIEITRV